MAYPPYLTRRTSYRDAENAGNPIDTANMDSEFNDSYEDINQLVAWIRNITTSTNLLKNLAAPTAQALAGTYRAVATASQTVFITTITTQTTFANTNVFVYSNGVQIDTTLVTVGVSTTFIAAGGQKATSASLAATWTP